MRSRGRGGGRGGCFGDCFLGWRGGLLGVLSLGEEGEGEVGVRGEILDGEVEVEEGEGMMMIRRRRMMRLGTRVLGRDRGRSRRLGVKERDKGRGQEGGILEVGASGLVR